MPFSWPKTLLKSDRASSCVFFSICIIQAGKALQDLFIRKKKHKKTDTKTWESRNWRSSLETPQFPNRQFWGNSTCHSTCHSGLKSSCTISNRQKILPQHVTTRFRGETKLPPIALAHCSFLRAVVLPSRPSVLRSGRANPSLRGYSSFCIDPLLKNESTKPSRSEIKVNSASQMAAAKTKTIKNPYWAEEEMRWTGNRRRTIDLWTHNFVRLLGFPGHGKHPSKGSQKLFALQFFHRHSQS